MGKDGIYFNFFQSRFKKVALDLESIVTQRHTPYQQIARPKPHILAKFRPNPIFRSLFIAILVCVFHDFRVIYARVGSSLVRQNCVSRLKI